MSTETTDLDPIAELIARITDLEAASADLVARVAELADIESATAELVARVAELKEAFDQLRGLLNDR